MSHCFKLWWKSWGLLWEGRKLRNYWTRGAEGSAGGRAGRGREGLVGWRGCAFVSWRQASAQACSSVARLGGEYACFFLSPSVGSGVRGSYVPSVGRACLGFF